MSHRSKTSLQSTYATASAASLLRRRGDRSTMRIRSAGVFRPASDDDEDKLMNMHFWVMQRKKIGLSRSAAGEAGGGDGGLLTRLQDGGGRSATTAFVVSTFERKECVRFVRRRSEGSRCLCGRSSKEHQASLNDKNRMMGTIVEEDELASTVGGRGAKSGEGGRRFSFDFRGTVVNSLSDRYRDDAGDGDFEYDRGKKGEVEDEDDLLLESNLKHFPTNAFGEIADDARRATGASKPKYLRLSDESPLAAVHSLLHDHWKIFHGSSPGLIIDFVGGSEEDQAGGGNSGSSFISQLSGVWSSVNALLTTDGLDRGVTKTLSAVPSAKLKLMGVCPWGLIKGRKSLVNAGGKTWHEASYDPAVDYDEDEEEEDGRGELANGHSFYLMVDNGMVGRGAEAGAGGLRAELCKYLKKALNIPVITAFATCGLSALLTLRDRLRRGDLCVVDGTGSVEDILLFAVQNIEFEKGRRATVSERSEEHLRELIGEAVEEEGGDKADVDDLLDVTVDIAAEGKNLILRGEKELDRRVLLRLLEKDLLGSRKLGKRLEVAVKWNRIDLAREILGGVKLKQDSSVEEIFTECLLEEKVDFAETLLEAGFAVKKYLSPRQLRTLYNRVLRKGDDLKSTLDHFAPSSLDNKGELCLSKVHGLLVSLLLSHTCYQYEYDRPDFRENPINLKKYRDMDPKFQDPNFELFIWAVLSNKHALMPFFHPRCERPILAAEVGAIIFDRLANFKASRKVGEEGRMQTMRDEYQDKASRLMEAGHALSPDKTFALLEHRIPRVGQRNLMELAYQGFLTKVIPNDPCQLVTDVNWRRGFVDIGTFSSFLCILCPLLLFTPLVKYRSGLGDDGGDFDFLQKLYVFYKCPLVKFVLSFISSFCFILLYSYVALFAYRWEYTYPELALYVWILVMVIDEVREVLESPAGTLSGKWQMYQADIWNKFDLLMIGLLAVTFVLKHFEDMFWISRVSCSFTSVGIWIKLFRFYHTNWRLGPKLHAMVDMVPELIIAMYLLVVLMLAYGVASQALIDPYRVASWEEVFRTTGEMLAMAYFQTYGELQLEEMEPKDTPQCTADQDDLIDYCVPEDLEDLDRYGYFTRALLALFLLFGNVLLLNMLIAVFTTLFEVIHDNSVNVWKWEMYRLMEEFDRKPTLPGPLVFFEAIYRILKKAWKTCCRRDRENLDAFLREASDELQAFEKGCMSALLEEEADEARRSQEGKIDEIHKRTAETAKKFNGKDGDGCDYNDIKDRLKGVEKGLRTVSRQLEEVMRQ